MLIPGLVSVTFRSLGLGEVVRLAAQAGLRGIEWGGDVHVPHGELEAARLARRLTADAGLQVIAYGSYFRFRPADAWDTVLETALELGAPLIRIWAGERPSLQADAAYRAAIAAEGRRIIQLAAQAGVSVAFEFHDGTLTDTLPATLSLLEALPGAQILWQPPHAMGLDERLAGLLALQPRLANLHVFYWHGQPRKRLPLASGAELWRSVLATIAPSGHDHGVLLEFVANDDPQQLLRDAATLNGWLQELAPVPA